MFVVLLLKFVVLHVAVFGKCSWGKPCYTRTMYEWRKKSCEERESLLAYRRLLHLPLHAPPHYADGRKTYLISAACFEHQPFMSDEKRREKFATDLLSALGEKAGAEIRAWIVLPNHYHVLATVDLRRVVAPLRLLHSAAATRWNREDGTPRRKVWFRYTDRRIRNDAHFWASFNYVHANPVKHGHVSKADEWPHSSLREHLHEHGRERLVELWKTYPVLNYGDGWDD